MKMKSISKLLLSLAVSAIALTGCYEDEGNYSYSEITEIQNMQGIDAIYTIDKGLSFLNIVPIIKTDNNGDPFVESDYTYSWRALVPDQTAGVAFTEISTEKNLVNVDPPLGKGTYTCYLHVTNKTNNISWDSQNFSVVINVAGEYRLGLLVLTKESSFEPTDPNEGTRLTLYSSDDYGRYVPSPIDLTVLPEGSMANPINVYCYIDVRSPLGNSGSIGYAVVVSSETGSYRLKSTDMSYVPAYALSSIIQQTPSEYAISDIMAPPAPDNGVLFFTPDGNAYRYVTGGNEVFYPNWNQPINNVITPQGTITYVLDPKTTQVLSTPSSRNTHYDAVKKVFLKQARGPEAKLQPLTRSVESTVDFPYDLSGTDLYCDQMMGVDAASPNSVHAAIRNATDPNYCQVWRYNVGSGAQEARYDLSGQPGISEAFIFRRMYNVAPFLVFYATPNTIYSYRIDNLGTGNAVPVFTAPAGWEFDDILLQHTGGIWTSNMIISYKHVSDPNRWRIELCNVENDEVGLITVANDGGTPSRPVVFEGNSELVSFAVKGN